MGIPKGRFLIDVGQDVVDLATMDARDWDEIKKIVRELIDTKTVEEPSKAYIAAFLVWLSDRQELYQPFDPSHDIMN